MNHDNSDQVTQKQLRRLLRIKQSSNLQLSEEKKEELLSQGFACDSRRELSRIIAVLEKYDPNRPTKRPSGVGVEGKITPFSGEELRLALGMQMRGATTTEIAKSLKRHPSTISKKLNEHKKALSIVNNMELPGMDDLIEEAQEMMDYLDPDAPEVTDPHQPPYPPRKDLEEVNSLKKDIEGLKEEIRILQGQNDYLTWKLEGFSRGWLIK